jgi:hypothetical protein
MPDAKSGGPTPVKSAREEIVITPPAADTLLGAFAGKIHIAEDFDALPPGFELYV